PEPRARLRQLLDPGGQLRLGPGPDERPGDPVRAGPGRSAVARGAAVVEVRVDPVEAYHGLLDDADVLRESVEGLREGQRERRLVFGEHPLCIALRPQLVSRERSDAAVAASHAVA